jgi:hypothetical protein
LRASMGRRPPVLSSLTRDGLHEPLLGTASRARTRSEPPSRTPRRNEDCKNESCAPRTPQVRNPIKPPNQSGRWAAELTPRGSKKCRAT